VTPWAFLFLNCFSLVFVIATKLTHHPSLSAYMYTFKKLISNRVYVAGSWIVFKNLLNQFMSLTGEFDYIQSNY
jgi:hypothetical protein